MSSPRSSTPPASTRRLLNELRDYAKDPNPCLVRLGPVSDNDLLHWEAVMKGVDSGGYENGRWLLTLTIPPTYPLSPPHIVFSTRIIHPNISFSDGEICLDLLRASNNSGPSAWTPAYTISAALGAIHDLLRYPEPDSPFNVDVAMLLRNGDRVGAEGLVRWGCGEWRWEGR